MTTPTMSAAATTESLRKASQRTADLLHTAAIAYADYSTGFAAGTVQNTLIRDYGVAEGEARRVVKGAATGLEQASKHLIRAMHALEACVVDMEVVADLAQEYSRRPAGEIRTGM